MLTARPGPGRRCNGDYLGPFLDTGPARAFDIDFHWVSLPGVRETADDQGTATFFLFKLATPSSRALCSQQWLRIQRHPGSLSLCWPTWHRRRVLCRESSHSGNSKQG